MDTALIIIGIALVSGVMFFAGYISKGITINIHKSDPIEVDGDGNPKYNESLIDLLPEKMRKEIEERYIRGEI